ncbi:MAG: NADH-quinone oxidoreductase subunit J [Actinomycetota bacterium]
MSGQLIAFFIVSALILSGALYIVTTRNIMHAVFMHLLTMSFIAAVYILLYAEFIAAMQVLIYAGAMTTMVIFALMLTRSQNSPEGMKTAVDNQQKGLAFFTAAGFLTVLLYVLIPHKWTPLATGAASTTVKQMGEIIFSAYVLPFELISVLLLAALVGVVVLTRKED